MELIRPDTRFDFVGKRKITIWISAAVILISLGSIFLRGGLRYGVDFAGGILLQIKFSKTVDISEVRNALEAIGSKDAMVQRFGGENEFLIRVKKTSGDLEEMSKTIQTSLQGQFKDKSLEIRRAEVVGPKVGKDLKRKALWAVGLSFLGILIYVAFRFHEFAYGFGGIVALFHDIIVTYGAISIFNLEYSLSLLAVILTIIGFSINDTIVIFDRVRENIKKMRKEDLETIFNVSINETLGRTILTSGTVMTVVLILFFFGGAVIHDFTTALIVGLITGTYSTVYVASPVVLFWERNVSRTKKRNR
ncbi:MAG: protein translocase subunit SecF [Deltaproteobacteria bacterium CG_4_8_14_3_um_filter_45_9]|nr:MAG: protein translocase subunit SecF [Deltaproteobacteria bacterium CG03_land_8_20_14_0_80_45_14]PIX22893.1 MAG: protein translocase subunit SecF [Deltaproteobacteria bacterium CG_4_8_14_3_um_filter_45_9]